jgi:hypothetical protein
MAWNVFYLVLNNNGQVGGAGGIGQGGQTAPVPLGVPGLGLEAVARVMEALAAAQARYVK